MSDIRVQNLFEAAVRGKWRFPFKGMISVEDLWDLSVENLDQIFKVLNHQRKKAEEESLLAIKSKEEILIGKIELVKYIVSVKLAEKEAAQKAAQDKEKKQTILSVIASKQEEALKNCTIEELQKMIKELEG